MDDVHHKYEQDTDNCQNEIRHIHTEIRLRKCCDMEVCHDSAQHPKSSCNRVSTEEHLANIHDHKQFQELEDPKSDAFCIKLESLHQLPAWFLGQILDHNEHKIIHAIKDIIHMWSMPDAV